MCTEIVLYVENQRKTRQRYPQPPAHPTTSCTHPQSPEHTHCLLCTPTASQLSMSQRDALVTMDTLVTLIGSGVCVLGDRKQDVQEGLYKNTDPFARILHVNIYEQFDLVLQIPSYVIPCHTFISEI